MAQSLLWKEVDLNATEELINSRLKTGFNEAIIRILNVEKNSKTGILCSLFGKLIDFCIKENLSNEKVSVLFAVLRQVHDKAMSEFLPMQASFDHFKKLLLAHSEQRPPFSVGIFDLVDIKIIVDFILDNYYRHFRLYKYIFTRRNVINIETKSKVHEEPMAFPALSEALSEEEWNLKKQREEEEREQARQASLAEQAAKRKAAREAEGINLPPSVEEIVERNLQAEIEKLRSEFKVTLPDEEETK